MTPTDRTLIGCEEWCQLESLGIPAIKARVDSGAKTSSIHAFNIQPFQRNDQPWVSFAVHPLQNNRSVSVQCEAPVSDRRLVKSSNGTSEKRYVINAPIQLGEQSFAIELTLTNRDSMGYRMLLGREAMQGRMIVDPAEHFQLGTPPSEQLAAFYGDNSQQPDGLKIGLLGNDPSDPSLLRLLEAGRAAGHEMVFLDLRECYVTLNQERPEVHYQGGHNLNDFDAVIPRISATTTFYGTAIIRHFESLGVYTLNSAEAIGRSHDQLLCLQILQSNELPIPPTVFSQAPTQSRDIDQIVGAPPLVVRFLEGPAVDALAVAETPEQLAKLLAGERAQRTNLLIQPYLSGGSNAHLRLLVIDGKVVSIETTADPTLQTDSGNPGKRTKLGREERQIAVRACRALRLKLAEVHLVRSSAGAVLLHLSATPDLLPMEAAKPRRDLARRVIHAVEKALEWRG